MRCMTFAKKTGLVALLAIMVGSTTSFAADERGVIGQFRGDDPKSELSINYDDLSALLEQTVLDTGMSDRKEASKARPTAGSRIIRGSTDPHDICQEDGPGCLAGNHGGEHHKFRR